MVGWQYLIISLASVAVGYLLSRLGARAERDARERRQLRDAVQALLTEVNANLKLTEKGVEPALLPRLAKDMWNIHKSNVAQLSLEIQESLHQAYSSIDKVNAVVDNMHAFGNRRNYGPGAWDGCYQDEAKRAREPMEKARDALQAWLKEQKENKPHDSLMRKFVISQVPVYFFASLLFIQGAGLTQKGESSGRYWVFISLGFILLIWAFILCVDVWRGQRIFRKVDQMTTIPYWVISTTVFGGTLLTNLVAVLQTGISNLYYYIFYFAGIALLILLLIHFVQSARQK